MLPQDALKKEATALLRNRWEQEDWMRDNEALRAYMVPLIVEVGALIQKHARRLGEDCGHDCAFQLDFFGDCMAWQLVEFITQSQFDNDARFENVNIHQFTERHAQETFDWPPAPESEAE